MDRLSPALAAVLLKLNPISFSVTRSATTTMLRPLVFRRASTFTRNSIFIQSRGAQVVNARFFQSRVEPRVIDKYREKLEKKLKSEGVESIDELKEVYKDKIEAVRKEAHIPEVEAVLGTPLVSPIISQQKNAPFNPPSPPKPVESSIANAARATTSPPGVKTLSSYVDVDKLSTHDEAKDIELIWRARFVQDQSSLCAVIPAGTYKRMEETGKQHPMFILPLPREGQGVEMHFLQWTFPHEQSSTIIFTSLAEYKLRGEFASPHTTLTHHLELSDTKNLILAQGSIVPDKGITVAEAQWLVVTLQKFYGAIQDQDAEVRRNMLRMFTQGDPNFSIEALIQEVEKMV
ncbi:ATP11 protein-domain-containing protein [Geopyxis carbonaria]|nr:ATP11 protein-domain-containing protein [Geopyxis carbonaria]